MPREKGADEVFCRSCGEPIKREAEICLECGVRNVERDQADGGGSVNRPSTTHDPSNYTTTVSDTWWQGVAAGTGIWVLGVLVSSASGSGAGADVAGLLMILAWALLPLSLYFDAEYVRANAPWRPSRWVYVGTAIVLPVFCIATGAVYLYRRHEVMGIP